MSKCIAASQTLTTPASDLAVKITRTGRWPQVEILSIDKKGGTAPADGDYKVGQKVDLFVDGDTACDDRARNAKTLNRPLMLRMIHGELELVRMTWTGDHYSADTTSFKNEERGPSGKQLYEWKQLASGTWKSREEYGRTSVNDAIAGAERFVNWVVADSVAREDTSYLDLAEKHKNLAAVLTWFRDKKQAQNLEDVLVTIERRQVQLEIIRLWAEMFPDKLPPGQICKSIRDAYPEVDQEIKNQLRESTELTMEQVRVRLMTFNG